MVCVTPPRADVSLNLRPASVEDYRELARRRLPRQIFDYVDGGAFSETTLRANCDDLRALQLRQRILRDVSTRQLATQVMGQHIAMPVILAPIGFGGVVAPRGEVLAARAAARAGVPFCESTLSVCSIEEVAQSVESNLWYQLYVMKNRSYAEQLMERAAAAGCTTLVLTVDLPIVGQRYRDVRNGISGGLSPTRHLRRAADIVRHPHWIRTVALGGRPLSIGNLEHALPAASVPSDFRAWIAQQFDPGVTWSDLAWIRNNWSGPLAVKGILDPEDARRAVDHGLDAVIVSNHGGRQLDSVPSAISALPGVVAAVAGGCDVLMDGGVRSGLDVVKALALGAKACLIGRPWVYGAAGNGEAGVDHVLQIIREEIHVSLALTGVTDIREIDASILLAQPT